MIIQCPACQARYHYDEARFAAAPVKKIRCTKCSNVFEIRRPALSADPAGSPAPSPTTPGPNDFTIDDTALTEPKGRRGPQPGAPARAMPMVERPAPGPAAPAAPAAGKGDAASTTGKVAQPTTGAGVKGRLRLPTEYRLSLACIAGPDAGRIFEIDKPRVVIGRANADIIVADIQCSRQHAAIEVMDDKVTLVDLGSTNGTFVAEQRVSRLDLENRTEFEIGTTTLMLIRSATDTPPGT